MSPRTRLTVALMVATIAAGVAVLGVASLIGLSRGWSMVLAGAGAGLVQVYFFNPRFARHDDERAAEHDKHDR